MLLVASMIGAAATPVAATQEGGAEGYSGAHVQFDAGSNSVVDYAVNGDVLLGNVTVQSASEAREQAGIGVDAGLETATAFRGSGLQVASSSSASATVAVDSGAEMRSHDNDRGVLQVRATEDDQMVRVELGDGAEADDEDDGRVVVEGDDVEGTFLVVGDGEVVVNEEGDVVAEVEQGSELVYRQYGYERSDNDEAAERMIQEGTATAEVYVQESEEESDDAAEATTHAVEYGQDTAVEVTSQSQDELEMTVERTESDGKVVLATVSEAAFDNAGDIRVYVDGEAAARADSYGAVQQSATEGDEPRFYVAESGSAQGTTDVAGGIDHFSERQVVMTSAEEDHSPTEDDGATDGGTDGDGAGLGVLAALAALGAALVAARRRT